MSLELQQVRRRISTARQVRQVTSALQKVSTARLANDRRAMERSRQYTRRLYQVMREVALEAPDADCPLAMPSTGPMTALIVFGSDRGLCGGYNRVLTDAMHDFLTRSAGGRVRLVIVGRVIARRVRRLSLEVFRFFPQPSRSARAEAIASIASIATESFLKDRCSEVRLLYMRFISGLRQTPVFEQVLPVELKSERGAPPISAFEPEPRAILAGLLPQCVRQSVDHAFLNSVASENAARQAAMSRASENASSLLSDLMMSYRRLRQQSITGEMLELMGGGSTGEA